MLTLQQIKKIAPEADVVVLPEDAKMLIVVDANLMNERAISQLSQALKYLEGKAAIISIAGGSRGIELFKLAE